MIHVDWTLNSFEVWGLGLAVDLSAREFGCMLGPLHVLIYLRAR